MAEDKPATIGRHRLIWIDGHIPSRVIEFFLTDWIQENAIHGLGIGYRTQRAHKHLFITWIT